MEELCEMIEPAIDQYLNLSFDWKLIYQSAANSIINLGYGYSDICGIGRVRYFSFSYFQLCVAEIEDILLLIITCLFKLHVWQQNFMCFTPYFEFSTPSLQALIFVVQQFELPSVLSEDLTGISNRTGAVRLCFVIVLIDYSDPSEISVTSLSSLI
ncbi:hypothetical protein K501DRAFT_272465 [Backusella circina FSU 941]|nr:hypothetical protein K501DRAFT_272465 [Backusella circina FSU 941]